MFKECFSCEGACWAVEKKIAKYAARVVSSKNFQHRSEDKAGLDGGSAGVEDK